jgi:S-adenosylmethionine-diacylglycerol 3-amino-3-carboxypropyl transferase
MADKYFNKLNYSLMNEDIRVERYAIDQTQAKSILSVAGSGYRSFNLINEHTESLTLIDMSADQIQYAKAKLTTLLELNKEEYYQFWGYMNATPEFRKNIHQKLKLEIDHLVNFDAEVPPTYQGNWEKTFLFFNKIVTKALGKDHLEEFASFEKLEDQIEFYQKHFKRKIWKLVVFILGNRAMFNALLYKGNFVKKNIPDSYLTFYDRRYDELFNQKLIRENFFVQLVFFGKLIDSRAYPILIQSSNYKNTQELLKNTQINFEVGSIFDHSKTYDFISLSNVPSYLVNDLERDYLKIMEKLLNPEGVLFERHYLRVPVVGLHPLKEKSFEFYDIDAVNMYQFKQYQKV